MLRATTISVAVKDHRREEAARPQRVDFMLALDSSGSCKIGWCFAVDLEAFFLRSEAGVQAQLCCLMSDLDSRHQPLAVWSG